MRRRVAQPARQGGCALAAHSRRAGSAGSHRYGAVTVVVRDRPGALPLCPGALPERPGLVVVPLVVVVVVVVAAPAPLPLFGCDALGAGAAAAGAPSTVGGIVWTATARRLGADGGRFTVTCRVRRWPATRTGCGATAVFAL